MIGLAVVLQVVGIVFYFFVAWVNSKPNLEEGRVVKDHGLLHD